MAAPEKTVEQELKAKAGENAENGPVQVTTAAAEETEAVEAQAGAEAQTEAEPTGLYQPVTLLFAGDVYFSNYVQNAYNRAGDISGVLDDGIRQEIADADIFMVNQEFPFTDRGEKVADKQFNFRCLAACKKAIRKGGLGPCAANGANEEAVRLFLEDKIGFLDIGRLVEAVVDSDSFGGDYTLSDVYECDRMAREFVRAHL